MKDPQEAKKFGSRWESLLASEDDWAEECNSSATSFAVTELSTDIGQE